MNLLPCLARLLLLALYLLPAPAVLALGPENFTPDDPRHCLTLASRALDAADSAAFELAVDLDAILGQTLDFMARQAALPEEVSQFPPILTLLFTRAAGGGGDTVGVRGLLMGAARAFVLQGIDSGAFGGRPADSAQTSDGGLLSPLFAEASLGRKEICLVGEARPVSPPAASGNGEWLVPFSVHDAGNGETYPVLGRIRKEGAGFRLVGVENMSELYGLIRNEMELQGP